MKRLFPLLLLVMITACNAPKPVAPSLTPPITPSPIPSAAPATRSAPVTSTDAPTRVPVQSTVEALMPVLETTIDLGPADFENLLGLRAMALDDQADRLYVSLSPSRTLVLDAGTLTPVDEIPFGGALSVNPAAQRLYISVPGSYRTNADGTSAIAPAELRLFDTSNLTLLRSVIVGNASTLPPLVTVDPLNNTAYLTQNGITIADATTLEVQGTLSGTFPIPNGLVPNYSAVDAAVVPQQQRLFVSLNNGIPGSNNGNVTAVYDLTTGQVIAQDGERSVGGFVVDETTGEVISPRSHIANFATVKYDAQGRALKRLDGAGGTALIDPPRDRVYLFQWEEDQSTLQVLDRDLNFLGAARFPEITVPQSVLMDPERDRVLVLQRDGSLFVIAGQGEPIGLAANAPVPDRQAAQLIVPSSNVEADRSLLAVFTPDEYTTGQGSAFRSDDEGATWQYVSGLPVGAITDLEFTQQMIFAAAGSNGATDGYGIWRSVDGGQTWRPASRGLADLGVMRLAVSPDFARDGTLYALSRRGVFRSTDRGETWVSLADRYAPLLNNLTVSFNAVALSPNFAEDNTLLIGHSSGLWRSTDRGETWASIDGGPAATRLAYAPDGSTVLAVDYNGVHRSTDGGSTWQTFNAGLDLGNSTVGDVQINDREAVVLVTSFDQPGAVYRLPVRETTWQGVPIETDVTALALAPSGALFIGLRDGTVQRLD